MPSRWFYKRDDAECGPVDSMALKELARNGTLQPEALIRKDGSPDWRPAGEAKGLFGSPPPNSSEVQQEPENNKTPPQPGDMKATPNITSPVGASVLVAIATAVCLHALQWLCGWGLGSLWGLLSTIVILTLGIIPWMLDYEGQKSAAAGFGAGVGAALGIAYGWFSGGVLSGVLFCTSISTWAAWLAERKGFTTRLAQVGVVAAALTGAHVVGMLSPATGGVAQRSRGTVSGTGSKYQDGWENGKVTAERYITLIDAWVERGMNHNTSKLRAELLDAAVRLKEQVEFYNRPQVISRSDGSNGPPTAQQATDWKDSGDYAKGAYDGFMSLARPYLP